MAMRHSTENLPDTQENETNICSICHVNYDHTSILVSTRCRHIFHRECISQYIETSPICPRCRNAVTRNSLLEYFHPNPHANASFIETANQGERILLGRKKGNRQINQNSRYTSMSQGIRNERVNANNNLESGVLEDRIRSDIENSFQAEITKLQEVVKRLSDQFTNFNLNTNKEPAWPRESLPSSFNPPNFELPAPTSHNSTTNSAQDARIQANFGVQRNSAQGVSSVHGSRDRPVSSSVLANSGKVASLISNWNVTFSGSSAGLPVEKFIYMITSLTNDSMGGDFQLVCEHSHLLFTSKAKEWYWRYRRSVNHIVWEDLCRAMKTHFSDHLCDLDIIELMRDRKQGVQESFDDFYHSILQLSDRLKYPLSEQDMTEILRRNLKPQIRKELFYLQINNVSFLRRLVLRREALSLELGENPKNFRRNINSIEFDKNALSEEELVENICELRKPRDEIYKEGRKICWNCRQEGHRYVDCMKERSIFCYGCGDIGVYKPQCVRCQGNLKPSVSEDTSLRSRANQ
ncbi:RING-H2 finger protein ATL30 [Lucilia cuprina]|nr:RING-H2 finger protein ATL30 [Lucilia cuprina]